MTLSLRTSADFPQIKRSRERGTVIVLSVILLLPIAGLLALGIDGFLMSAARLQLDSNAEYAALSALRRMQSEDGTVAVAIAEAERVSGLNFYVGSSRTEKSVKSGELRTNASDTSGSGNILFGRYTPANGQFEALGSCASGCNAVQVTLRTLPFRGYRTMFAPTIGGPAEVRYSSKATAFYDSSKQNGAQSPYFIVGTSN